MKYLSLFLYCFSSLPIHPHVAGSIQVRPRLGFGAFQVSRTHLQLLQPGWTLDQWLGQNLEKKHWDSWV